MAKELVGFVGTGHMGGPMTLRLLAAGYGVCVYDRDKKAMQALVKKVQSPRSRPQMLLIVLRRFF